MKIALHVLTYNVDSFLNHMLTLIYPHMHKFLVYPSRPFSYILESRNTKTNPTILENLNLTDIIDKIEIGQTNSPKFILVTLTKVLRFISVGG